MRETGLIIGDRPKIHYDNPDIYDNSIFDQEYCFRIPLTLNRIFSVFKIRSLKDNEIKHAVDYESVFLTHDSNTWNPYCVSYQENEESLLSSRG